MDFRQLGGSGFKVPVLSLGTGTFGGRGDLFASWGATDVAEATRLVDVCLEAGLNMFDSADVYSAGAAEEILGAAIKGRRDQVIISTKGTFRTGTGPNDVGSSRHHLTRTIEASLKRLGTDYIDLYQLHAFDAMTPIEEVLETFDVLVRATIPWSVATTSGSLCPSAWIRKWARLSGVRSVGVDLQARSGAASRFPP